MFTIDLLKGQGLPMKSRPAGIAVSAVAIVVPLIVAIVMVSVYLRNRIIISMERQEIARWEDKIEKLSELIKEQESFERDRAAFGNCLAEVRSNIGRYTQWSPVLAAVVENIPESVMLNSMEVKQSVLKKKVSTKGDAQKTSTVDVPIRTLRVSVSANPQAISEQTIRDFRARLLASAVLGPRLDTVTVSQESGEIDNQQVVIYQIDCVFKPGL